MRPNPKHSYFEIMEKEGLYSKAGNLEFMVGQLFPGFDFKGKRVLDIGGGAGLLTFFASAMGAAEAVCLEPEAAGSTAGVRTLFDRVRDGHPWGPVQLLATTFQEYAKTARPFDLLISHASINHLDEEACIELRRSPAARSTYVALGREMHRLLRPGGALVICDSSCRNLFADLHVPNPVDPGLEWHKHQTPRTWIEVLQESGFKPARLEYKTFNSLGRIGKALLGNRLASYCFVSSFILELKP